MTPNISRRVPGGIIFAVILIFIVLAGARTGVGWILDYQWWQEMGQVSTWISLMLYSIGPTVAVALVAFAVFWIAHARGMKAGGVRLSIYPLYARLATLAIAIVSLIFGSAAIDSWTVVRYFGGRGGAGTGWQDPVFGHPLSFYLFELPFYRELLHAVLGLCVVAAIVYWLTARGWQMRDEMPDARDLAIKITNVSLSSWLESGFLRGLVAVFLLALAMAIFLNRYTFLLEDHGFMVGADWVAETIRIPLAWISITFAIASAGLVCLKRYRIISVLILALVLSVAVPPLVNSLYVKPNEITIQKPYIQRHIEATRAAFGLSQRTSEKDYLARADVKIDVNRNRALLDNVRLWDWRAFHDTVSQIQPLRPYTFSDTDVDRYTIDGQLRQVMVSPREIDLNQLGDARSRWINPHFVYTHGYGLVMAEANRIDANGLPNLIIRDAPPIITTPSLKLTRPELYFGEEIHEPVFVNTSQPEFNYPSGADNVHTKYEGKGGFPISSVVMRFIAALSYGDWNILLTSQLQPNSRMMIHRAIVDRVHTLAGFVDWDRDPYLVLSGDGHLFWMIDGYLTSDAHPYSRSVEVEGMGTFNYIRNSVKATVDAYDGAVKLYVFDEHDPLVQAYRNLFPALFSPESEMPKDLRAHARYPETMFSAQAEIYRTFHMRDAEAFYNKADMWDIARWVQGQEAKPQALSPVYVVATMPGDEKPEFTLMIPFTPRNKDNLIGLMAAHCDGSHLGEMSILLLSKQEMLLGPMQVEARINQDQNISKDLTLWNQQGSQVLRGQMVVLPVDGTMLYVEPIYIQAKEARMPQMKKVVVAVGNTLIYADSYPQALAQLAGVAPPEAESAQAAGAAAPDAKMTAIVKTLGQTDPRIESIRGHLQRYRELAAQGKWADAGKELELIESIVKK